MSEHELWNELGNLYFLSGVYDQAIHAYNRAIALSPESGEPYSNLAQTYMQMGRFAEASECYQRGIQYLNDGHEKVAALHELGDAYMRLNQYSLAMETFQQADGLIPKMRETIKSAMPFELLLHCKPSDDKSYPSVIMEGTRSASSSQVELVPFIEEFTPWWFDDQIEPEEEPEYDLWSLDKNPADDFNENVVFTEPLKWDLESVYQSSLTGHETRVMSISQADEPNINVAGMHESVSMFSSRELASQKQYKADADTLVAEPDPLTVMVVADEPEVMTQTPEFSAESITIPCEAPVELPVVELSQDERAVIQADIQKFKRVLEINPRNAFAWDTLGGNYKALGQYDDAIHAYQKAVSLDSTKAFYFHHLGLVYAAVGRYDDAIAAFERVIGIDPNHSLSHAALGGYYRKNGNEELAQEYIEKARALLANDENEYNCACMEAICGNTDRSLELLEIALKNRQTYVNWARKDPDLDFIRSDPRFHALLAEYAARSTQ